MYCKRCGKELNNQWEVCPYCGEQIKRKKVVTNDSGEISHEIAGSMAPKEETAYREDDYTNLQDISLNDKTKKERRIILAIFAGCIILSIVLFISIFSTNPKTNTNSENHKNKKTSVKENRVDLTKIDMESAIGQTKGYMKDLGFDMAGVNQNTSIKYNADGTVNEILIEGDTASAPTFHGVKIGMNKDEAVKTLSDAYPASKDDGKSQIYNVKAETKECVDCGYKDNKITSILYKVLSDDEVKEYTKAPEHYIFPDSDKKYLSEAEVRSVSVNDMLIGRNEIFARHGRMFDMPELAEYFSQQSWYNGTIPADQFDSSVLNDFEKKNVDLIKKVEDELNGVSTSNSAAFDTSSCVRLEQFWSEGSRPSNGAPVNVVGRIRGVSGSTFFVQPNQVLSDVIIYYDSSQYTPVEGNEVTVYGTYRGTEQVHALGAIPAMDGYYFE